jgi:cell wall-associated NlpC family hydrolase
MKSLSTKVFMVALFVFTICIGLQLKTYKVLADAQAGSQQGVVLKSANLTTGKVIKTPKKETSTTNNDSKNSSSSNNSSKSSSSSKSSNGSNLTLSRGSVSTSGGKMSVVSKAYEFLGRPYVWGASGPRAFDCSGFTSYVYSSFGVSLPHKASSQAGIGQTVSRNSLQAGDLVFFNTTGGISHVGIYIGSGQFIHASSGSDKVTVSELSSSYYSTRFVTAKRMLR